MESCGDEQLIARSLTSRYSEGVVEALDELPDCFLITDPGLAGHPVVFASRAFLAMSGYPRSDVLGRNARAFQGPATDRRAVAAIREAVRGQTTMQISLLNYKRDGTPHWILFHMSPVFGAADGRVLHFLAVQVPLSRRKARSCCAVLAACREEARVEDGFGLGCGDDAEEVFLDMDKRG